MVEIKTEVAGIEMYSEDNFLLKLKKPRGFQFTAGQFAMLHFNGNQKPFSIASHPSDKYLEFLIKEHDDGPVTPYLMKLRKGDNVVLSGPFGAFVLKDTKADEIVFIATGTGVAPFRSLIVEALKKFPGKKVFLIFGFRNDLYFEKIWKKLKKDYKNFDYVTCCSKKGVERCSGLKGRVTDNLEGILKSGKGREVYICGSERAVEDCKRILVEKCGFKEKQIKVEEWRSAKKK